MNNNTTKTIVITGCSSGFGRLTALQLARQGWHVFGTVRKDDDKEPLLNELNESIPLLNGYSMGQSR